MEGGGKNCGKLSSLALVMSKLSVSIPLVISDGDNSVSNSVINSVFFFFVCLIVCLFSSNE